MERSISDLGLEALTADSGSMGAFAAVLAGGAAVVGLAKAVRAIHYMTIPECNVYVLDELVPTPNGPAGWIAVRDAHGTAHVDFVGNPLDDRAPHQGPEETPLGWYSYPRFIATADRFDWTAGDYNSPDPLHDIGIQRLMHSKESKNLRAGWLTDVYLPHAAVGLEREVLLGRIPERDLQDLIMLRHGQAGLLTPDEGIVDLWAQDPANDPPLPSTRR